MLKHWYKSGTPWIWLNAGALSISLIMVIGLIVLIASRGLSHFWPPAVYAITYAPPDSEPQRLLASLQRSERVTAAVVREAGFDVPQDQAIVRRHLLKLGNRDLSGRDFAWFIEDYMGSWTTPAEALVLERTTWGDFYGYLKSVQESGETIAEGEVAWRELVQRVARAENLRKQINHIERYAIGNVSHQQEQIRLDKRRLELQGKDHPEALAELDARHAELDEQYQQLDARRTLLYQHLQRDSLTAETSSGRVVTIPLEHVVRAFRPNALSLGEKLAHYGSKLREFIFDYPREANTEGGIFPAIFGTVMMVLIMSVLVTPFGVLAAIYLREYARQGPLTRLIRICVNNLAGVPSIVFGVFGVGFFVYFLGGHIDQAFYPEALPSPTFGRPGLFWASLTLARLTLPVVIVATEEGLARIPQSVREGSLALGATKAETIWRVVVPMAAPAMMTGLILAVARAAGEVAPLMLVGVVKLAPTLPVDGTAPYVHLDRSFMHLGFHIFDVGFQSPNVEAARPLVYATALVLVVLIVALNLAAMSIRNRLREKYRSASD